MLEILLVLKIKDVNLDKEREQEMKEKKLQSHKQNILQLSKREKKVSNIACDNLKYPSNKPLLSEKEEVAGIR